MGCVSCCCRAQEDWEVEEIIIDISEPLLSRRSEEIAPIPAPSNEELPRNKGRRLNGILNFISPQDDELDNLCAFSTKQKMMCAVSDEGLLHRNEGKGIDHRIKIRYSDRQFQNMSYYNLCQVTTKLPDSRKAVGSACYIQDGVYLSSAHNILAVSLLTKLQIMFKETKIYRSRQGKSRYHSVIRTSEESEDEIKVHPKFNGKSECGFDICIFKTTKSLKPETQADVIFPWPKLEDIKKGMSVEIAGYPGEKGGYPYTHRGKIIDITSTAGGGRLLWYDTDTTPGNSGSPIMITDRNYVKKFSNETGICKVIVGIHTGNDEIEGLNFGTLITKKIYNWIYNE